jgi:IMP dehydrogenase
MTYIKILPQRGLTFDDVLIVPGKSETKREDIDLSVNLTPKITLSIPLISSPMDTVTDARMATALGNLGGLGIIHRNMMVTEQADQVKKAKDSTKYVGAAVGVGNDFNERVGALVKAGADVIVIDSDQGFSKYVIEATEFVAINYKETGLIAGNVATYEGALALANAGAQAIRVGMGPGSICTTRIIAGIGIPQITAIIDCFRAVKDKGVTLIADGGIRYPGDIVKALAAGGSVVMLGSLLAGTTQAPGKEIQMGDKVYKSYRGMGSVSAMMEGSAARYGQEYRKGKEKKLIPEGVEGMLPFKGNLEDVIAQLIGGLRSGMYYAGVSDIKNLQEKTTFLEITQASLIESHPHDIIEK